VLCCSVDYILYFNIYCRTSAYFLEMLYFVLIVFIGFQRISMQYILVLILTYSIVVWNALIAFLTTTWFEPLPILQEHILSFNLSSSPCTWMHHVPYIYVSMWHNVLCGILCVSNGYIIVSIVSRNNIVCNPGDSMSHHVMYRKPLVHIFGWSQPY